jgi:(p)ppGpp synthase/HD superfamily hydrolase
MNLLNAAELVKTRIQGTRKGSLEPAYQHSWRVANTLEQHEFHSDAVLAAMLHDIVEDGETSLAELEQLGCNQTVLHLVDLASHSMSLPATTALEKDQRWAGMVYRLEQAQNVDAWAIKMADLLDNLRGCRSLPPERQAVFLEVKAPTYLRLTNGLLGSTRCGARCCLNGRHSVKKNTASCFNNLHRHRRRRHRHTHRQLPLNGYKHLPKNPPCCRRWSSAVCCPRAVPLGWRLKNWQT